MIEGLSPLCTPKVSLVEDIYWNWRCSGFVTTIWKERGSLVT